MSAAGFGSAAYSFAPSSLIVLSSGTVRSSRLPSGVSELSLPVIPMEGLSEAEGPRSAELRLEDSLLTSMPWSEFLFSICIIGFKCFSFFRHYLAGCQENSGRRLFFRKIFNFYKQLTHRH